MDGNIHNGTAEYFGIADFKTKIFDTYQKTYGYLSLLHRDGMGITGTLKKMAPLWSSQTGFVNVTKKKTMMKQIMHHTVPN